MANHHNPLPVLIPCHRVVGRDGALTSVGECDMIKEANRILEDSVNLEEKGSRGQIFLGYIKRTVIPFLVGITVGMITAIIIK